jgi:hypothetical protein
MKNAVEAAAIVCATKQLASSSTLHQWILLLPFFGFWYGDVAEVFGQTEEDHQIITSYAITQTMQRIYRSYGLLIGG